MLDKAKETALFIIKSAVFLYISDCINTIASMLTIQILAFDFFWISSKLIPFIDSIYSQFIYIVFSYFTAKKLGIIKFIEKSPIWIIVLIIIIYELAVTLPYEPTSLYLAHEWKRIILNTLSSIKLGFGCIYPILIYILVRFLTNKYPKLSFLKNFYFLKKLENIITFKNIKNKIKCIFSKFINWWKKNYRLY